MEQETQVDDQLTEEELKKLGEMMKDNTPSPEDKQNVHTFLQAVMSSDENTKIGNLRDGENKSYNELGYSNWTVRGALEMKRISDKIIDNEFFADYFKTSAEETLQTSLSRNGFLIRQGTTQTKQMVDATRRRRTSRGLFGKKEEETGGDITQ